jgi:hypothetical protein
VRPALDEHGRLTAAGKSTKQLLSEKSNRPECLEIVHGAYLIGRQGVRNSQEFEVGRTECLQSSGATAARMAIDVITVAGSPQVPGSKIPRPNEEQSELVDERAGPHTA